MRSGFKACIFHFLRFRREKVFETVFQIIVQRNIFLSSTYKCNFLGADNKQ